MRMLRRAVALILSAILSSPLPAHSAGDEASSFFAVDPPKQQRPTQRTSALGVKAAPRRASESTQQRSSVNAGQSAQENDRTNKSRFAPLGNSRNFSTAIRGRIQKPGSPPYRDFMPVQMIKGKQHVVLQSRNDDGVLTKKIVIGPRTRQTYLDVNADGNVDFYEVARGNMLVRAMSPYKGRFARLEMERTERKGLLKMKLLWSKKQKRYKMVSRALVPFSTYQAQDLVIGSCRLVDQSSMADAEAWRAQLNRILAINDRQGRESLQCMVSRYQNALFDPSCLSEPFGSGVEDMREAIMDILMSSLPTAPGAQPRYLQCLDGLDLGVHSARIQAHIYSRFVDVDNAIRSGNLRSQAPSSCEPLDLRNVRFSNSRRPIRCEQSHLADERGSFQESTHQITLHQTPQQLSRLLDLSPREAVASTVFHELVHESKIMDESYTKTIEACCGRSDARGGASCTEARSQTDRMRRRQNYETVLAQNLTGNPPSTPGFVELLWQVDSSFGPYASESLMSGYYDRLHETAIRDQDSYNRCITERGRQEGAQTACLEIYRSLVSDHTREYFDNECPAIAKSAAATQANGSIPSCAEYRDKFLSLTNPRGTSGGVTPNLTGPLAIERTDLTARDSTPRAFGTETPPEPSQVASRVPYIPIGSGGGMLGGGGSRPTVVGESGVEADAGTQAYWPGLPEGASDLAGSGSGPTPVAAKVRFGPGEKTGFGEDARGPIPMEDSSPVGSDGAASTWRDSGGDGGSGGYAGNTNSVVGEPLGADNSAALRGDGWIDAATSFADQVSAKIADAFTPVSTAQAATPATGETAVYSGPVGPGNDSAAQAARIQAQERRLVDSGAPGYVPPQPTFSLPRDPASSSGAVVAIATGSPPGNSATRGPGDPFAVVDRGAVAARAGAGAPPVEGRLDERGPPSSSGPTAESGRSVPIAIDPAARVTGGRPAELSASRVAQLRETVGALIENRDERGIRTFLSGNYDEVSGVLGWRDFDRALTTYGIQIQDQSGRRIAGSRAPPNTLDDVYQYCNSTRRYVHPGHCR